MIHTVKGFGIVNKAEIDVFLELSCFFSDPVDVGNLGECFAFFFLQMDVRLFLHHLLKGLFSIDLLLRPCQKSVSCMYFYRFSVSLMYVSTLSQYHTESILETTLSFELRH